MAPVGKKAGGKKGKAGKAGGAKRKVKGAKSAMKPGKNQQATQSKSSKNMKAKTKANRLLQAQVRAEAEAEVARQEEGGLPIEVKPEEDDAVPEEVARNSSGSRAVMFMGGIPEGFFEPQIKMYFSQFGTVTRVHVARSNKTARSKGYGWVEFEEYGVAEIAAETMNGYMMFDTKLRCHMVPDEKVPDGLFKRCHVKKIDRTKLRRAEYRSIHNGKPTIEVNGERIARSTTRQVRRERLGAKDKRLKELLSTLDVHFDPSVADEMPKRAKAAQVAEQVEKSAESPVVKAAVAATNEAIATRKKGLKKKSSQKVV